MAEAVGWGTKTRGPVSSVRTPSPAPMLTSAYHRLHCCLSVWPWGVSFSLWLQKSHLSSKKFLFSVSHPFLSFGGHYRWCLGKLCVVMLLVVLWGLSYAWGRIWGPLLAKRMHCLLRGVGASRDLFFTRNSKSLISPARSLAGK